MIKNCIVFRCDNPDDLTEKLDRSRIEAARLKDCLKSAKGRNLVRMQGLAQLMSNEKIDFHASTQQGVSFSYSCKYKGKQPTAAGDAPAPAVPVKFDIWIRKQSGFAVTFDAGRKLSAGPTALISYASFGHPVAFHGLKLDKNAFAALKERVSQDTERSDEGILRATLQNVELDNVRFKQVALRAQALESSKLFQRMFEGSAAVSNMTFNCRPQKSSSRPLCWKLSSWGGITVYTPSPLQSELADVISLVEQISATAA